ncbi:HD-GYP domain-containing protein [Clostridium senegalense]|uniref:HD-GYP domain-containing protein n=1 Tax=Clostridium senegalense TaxID=1465809 RepID=UPI0002893582|nr:HD-GYP domain-containing protein [Clostridium senegalense]MBU5226131.1 HD-GYP domain-containing protein [Clostridium senegalense]
MRFELITNVKENEILGKSILDTSGRILLKSGVKLTNQYISRLESLGVIYIYVKDERLEDIEIEDTMLCGLKQDIIKCLGKVMKNVGSLTQTHVKEYVASVKEMIDYIVELKDINKSLYEIKTHDNYTMLHSVDTGANAAFMGLAFRMNRDMLNELVIGSTLHDIGKVKVPINIIDKKGPLTKEEFDEIKKHPIYGGEAIKKSFNISNSALRVILEHHEKIDGSGYPYGLKDEQISIYSKITAVCDVFDALTSDRSYRKKFNPADAYEMILSGSGTSFDKEVVKKFKNVFSIYPLGCRVKLSNGYSGFVVRQNQGFPDRPIIRVMCDNNEKMLGSYYEINLLKKTDVIIIGAFI